MKLKRPALPHLDETGGADDLALRDALLGAERSYRGLTRKERSTLERLGNTSSDWTRVLVADGFDPTLVQRCGFSGTVRIGSLTPVTLRFHDLTLPVGLSDSLIVSSDIGNNAVVRNVGYLSRYVIGDEVMLFNIDEMVTTNHAKFGNGIVMEGEPEKVRIRLEIANENGGRDVLPFDGIETGDAWLWSHYREDGKLREAFVRMTDERFSRRLGVYGSVGTRSVVKSCRIIKDTKIGEGAYIKGANKLKNITIKSSPEAPTQIGEGVELVNGIIERGSRAFYGVKAVRFVMRTNTVLKYGARLINSILGDNGTISCCEVLNSLVFPGHEQHHNNSFLCAATLLGQSNMAAAATIGSNHNSRANDGEIVAGRGFWPGLSVSLKHSSRFASYCLISKGSYPAELFVPLAFTLVATNERELVLRPAFWFHYNMYALARNSWKYGDRDARLYEYQEYEYDYLAPDTADEILNSIHLIELWTGMSERSGSTTVTLPEASFGGAPSDGTLANELAHEGRILLEGATGTGRDREELVLIGAGIERTSRPVRVLDVRRAWETFREMANLYAVRTLVGSIATAGNPASAPQGIHADDTPWRNVGGQLMRADSVETLLSDVRSGNLGDWDAIHRRYREIAAHYPEQRAEHAASILRKLARVEKITDELWSSCRAKASRTQRAIERETAKSREKDYHNPFRSMMYESSQEMELVVGALEENGFIKLIREQSDRWCRLFDA